MTLRLRAAGEGDLAAIMAVMASAFDSRFGEAWSAAQVQGSLGTDGAWARIALDDDAVVGFCLCRRAGPEAELLLIGVPAAARGRGFGTALLATAKRDARARGADTLFLEVRDGNVAALGLYRASGFVAVGRRRDYYRGNGDVKFDAITLRCDLAR